MIIEGKIAIKAALQYGKREVKALHLPKKNDKDLNYIKKLAKDIPIYEADSAKAEVGYRKSDVLDEDGPIFCLLGIQDPYNLAYCLRTLAALGCQNVILDGYDFGESEAKILRSSAGAYDLLNIYSGDYFNYLKRLKEAGYRILCLQRGDNSLSIKDYPFDDKAIIILGGEKRGIPTKILELADTNLFIPYGSTFRNALNAAEALAIVAWEVYRD